jgi:hypothetical protein
VGSLIDHGRVSHRAFGTVAGLAARQGQTKGEYQECQATGGAHCHEVPFLGFAGVFSLKWSPDA